MGRERERNKEFNFSIKMVSRLPNIIFLNTFIFGPTAPHFPVPVGGGMW